MPILCPARMGKYSLLRHLSSGGMADLYEARLHGIENFRRSIAIKIVRKPDGLSEADQRDFVDMFIDEARVCGQLTHANIAQVYELGKINGLPYMAMELVEGHSLSQLRRRAFAEETQLPLTFVAYVLSHTAMGLDYAHRRMSIEGEALNIVHRDVSPDNILISYEGEVKVIDFGVAHARQRRRKTEDGGLRGKLPYMAPEQARQEAVDARADIFGLGAVLYELAAGRRLYLSSGMELFIAARDGLLPDFSRTLADVPAELTNIIGRCVAVDRERRYRSAAEVGKALEPFLIRERSIFSADDAARMVASLFPARPNRRRFQGDDEKGPEVAEMRTEVVQTFDKEFYKRQTIETEAIDAVATLESVAAEAGDSSSIRDAAPSTDPREQLKGSGSRKDRNKTLSVVAALSLFIVAGSVGAGALFTPSEPVKAVVIDRGYVAFAAHGDRRARVSINGKPFRALPKKPVELDLGTHRLRFRVRTAKGKVINARQQITVTERHTREKPLRVSFRSP